MSVTAKRREEVLEAMRTSARVCEEALAAMRNNAEHTRYCFERFSEALAQFKASTEE
jgi:CHAD domain-containing protein